jgi:hypothetical protein
VKIALRTLVVASLFAAILAGLLFGYPTFADDAADAWRLEDYRSGIEEADESSRELERKVQVVIRRNAMKQETMQDLLDGRITFADAAVRFAQINRQHLQRPVYSQLYPGRTEEDRAARQLVQYLRALQTPESRALADAWDFLLFDRGLSAFVTGNAQTCEESPVRWQCRGPSESSARRD